MNYTSTITIIGAGPAGIASGIQLKRFGFHPVLLESENTGGLLLNANLVENYPGFPDGITGPELVRLFEKHLRNLDIDVCRERVVAIDHRDENFVIETDKREIRSPFTIISSGAKPKKIELKLSQENLAEKIFYEVYKLGSVENKQIAIIGSGDAAFDYALNLSKRNKVIILNRSDKTKCLSLLWERSISDRNIEYRSNITVQSVGKADGRLSLDIEDTVEKKKLALSADYLLIAVGREPETSFIDDKFKSKTDELIASGRLYFAGDVVNESHRQASIAIGDGIRTAMKIRDQIESERSASPSVR